MLRIGKGIKDAPGRHAVEVLRFDSVHFRYPGGPPILDGVDLRVMHGRVTVLQGRSGSGKSSMLSLAAGLASPSRGTVSLMGRPLPVAAAAVRAKHIGLVFQHLNLLDELNVRENIELPLRLQGAKRPVREAAVAELSEMFGIRGLLARRPASLSGGEQQRVAIARALATKPKLLLADEPTSSLDRENAQLVIQALEAAAESGAAVLVAAHDELLTGRPNTYQLDAGRLRNANGI